MKYDLKEISSHFAIYGDFVIAVPFGTGHINDTFQVTFNQAGTVVHYTIQRINHNIFKNPVKLMENIERVTSHLASKNGIGRNTLQVVRTKDGQSCYKDENGNFWRCYLFVENYTDKDAEVNIVSEAIDVETRERVKDTFVLPAYSIRILRQML